MLDHLRRLKLEALRKKLVYKIRLHRSWPIFNYYPGFIKESHKNLVRTKVTMLVSIKINIFCDVMS